MQIIWQPFIPFIFLVLTGFVARRYFLADEELWRAIDRLNFRLLFPFFIFSTLIRADFRSVSGVPILVTVLAMVGILFFLLFLFQRLFVPKLIDARAYSSVFQASTRWNTALAIIVINLFFGHEGVAIIALIMLVFTPVVNFINIAMLVHLLHHSARSPSGLAVQIFKNPIIIACLAGISVSVLQLKLSGWFVGGVDKLAEAAVPMLLLSLGAGITLSGLRDRFSLVLFSSVLKLGVMPALFLGLGLMMGVPGDGLAIAVIALAMPTAVNGYVVAREMGGDAPLYASICTSQTLISVLTVPAWIMAMTRFF